LKEKLLNERENEQNNILSQVRDYPSVSNKITWIMQIERKLKKHMERVKDILGNEWEKHIEGKELNSLGELL
jgi:dynein heavy chain 1